jgi:peptidoglycan/xylan/chitin deacetylase (PgdA/CDA1 family)
VTLSLSVKRTGASLLHATGATGNLLQKIRGGDVLIVMYHRIADPKAGLPAEAGMYVDQEAFERHVRFFKKHFTVIPITRCMKIFNEREPIGSGQDKPFCVLTFDDGWLDVFENAFPILRKYETCATVFLATGFVGTRNWFWTDRLAHLLRRRDGVALRRWRRALSGSVAYGDPEALRSASAADLEGVIAIMKTFRQEKIDEVLRDLSDTWGVDPTPPGRAFLSWEEARDMQRSGIMTFGSHTESHRILTTLTELEVARELKSSRDRLVDEGLADPALIPFAYPNGDYSEGTVSMVKEAGYGLAVTTKRGWNRTGPETDPYRLRRVGLHQDMASSDAMLSCRLLGIL